MAIAASSKANGAVSNTVGATTSTTSKTPSANALQLLLVNFRQGASGGVVSGVTNNNGGTWVLVDEFDNFDSGGVAFAYLYRALIASPSAGTADILTNATDDASLSYSWMEFTGVNPAGTNGSGAIQQHLKGGPTTSGTASKSLSALQTGSASYGGICLQDNNTVTAGSGYTIGNQNGATSGKAAAEYNLSGSTTVNATFTSTPWVIFSLELLVAPPGLFLPSRYRTTQAVLRAASW